MAKFGVKLKRTTVETASFELDAGSDQEVRDLVQTQVMIEELPWRRASTGEEEVLAIWQLDENDQPADA